MGLTLAGQLPQQTIGDVVDIVQPFAQIGVCLALQFGAGVILHALDGCFCGQAGAERLAQAAQPAAVIGEHAHGFEHVAMLADAVYRFTGSRRLKDDLTIVACQRRQQPSANEGVKPNGTSA